MKKQFLLFVLMFLPMMANADNDYVDLGLPSGLLWATCNLGASAPEEVGNYYAWGETSPKLFFSKDNYQYENNPINVSNISGTEYDAATVALGGTWRMPTKAELEELANECTRKQITLNGTVCMELTGPNGNKLIIARGGLGEQGTSHEDGYGLWSSTKFSASTAYRAWEWTYISFSYTWQGIPIRPVKDKKTEDNKCETPTISLLGGKLHFDCKTEGVTFHYSISYPEISENTGNNIDLSSICIVNVYATKEGYDASNIATAEIDIRGLKGDVNADGEVNVADLVTTTNIIMGKDK